LNDFLKKIILSIYELTFFLNVFKVKNQYPWKQDRRVKRDSFENIRFDVKHQIALLTLACTDILSPHIGLYNTHT
jgi:hypothetical protein